MNFKGILSFTSFLFIVKAWIYEKVFQQRSQDIQDKCVSMPWYDNKSINWGDTNDFIANFRYIFLDKILKDTIQNNFSKSRKFLSQISVMHFRSR